MQWQMRIYLTSKSMLVYLLGIGEYLPEFAPMTAERMLFIHSNVDYNFTAIELNWLTFTSEMFKGQTDTGINIFAFEMSCSSDDYYIPSAALIKIFNVAFPGDNLFVFKVGQNFSIGCKRTFLSEPPFVSVHCWAKIPLILWMHLLMNSRMPSRRRRVHAKSTFTKVD